MTIQQKIDQIITLAGELDKCSKDNSYLFKKINELPQKEIKELLNIYNNEYFFTNGKIQPVNLIRYYFFKLLESGKEITPDEVEKAKERFVQKDTDYFSEYSNEIKNAIEEYPIGNRTPFHVWKKPFRIFYLYFFSGKTKESVNLSLEEISSYIVKELKLTDYKAHSVNFDGSNNFGATRCWFSFFPAYKMKHTNAVQLFLSIRGSGLEYGVYTGSDLKSMETIDSFEINTDLQSSRNIDDVIAYFKSVKGDVDVKNKSIKQFWKYAPGEGAKYWQEMKNNGIMAIGWDSLEEVRVLEEMFLSDAAN